MGKSKKRQRATEDDAATETENGPIATLPTKKAKLENGEAVVRQSDSHSLQNSDVVNGSESPEKKKKKKSKKDKSIKQEEDNRSELEIEDLKKAKKEKKEKKDKSIKQEEDGQRELQTEELKNAKKEKKEKKEKKVKKEKKIKAEEEDESTKLQEVEEEQKDQKDLQDTADKKEKQDKKSKKSKKDKKQAKKNAAAEEPGKQEDQAKIDEDSSAKDLNDGKPEPPPATDPTAALKREQDRRSPHLILAREYYRLTGPAKLPAYGPLTRGQAKKERKRENRAAMALGALDSSKLTLPRRDSDRCHAEVVSNKDCGARTAGAVAEQSSQALGDEQI
jgi:hypothetical protein